MLRLYLLGNPRLEDNGRAANLSRRKALALLAYLAVSRQPRSRDELAALFWAEQDQSGARTNLRRDLSVLKQVLGDEALSADQQQVSVNLNGMLWLDVADFDAQIDAARAHAHPDGQICDECAAHLSEAAALYAGDFMAGFSLPDSAAFEEWQFFEAERLRRRLAGALQGLIEWHIDRDEIERGIDYGRRWLALDPLHEPAHRRLMQLYAWSGQQSAALRQYQECVRLLKTELDAPPEAATTTLYEAIRTKQLTPPKRAGSETAPPPIAAPSDLQQTVRYCLAADGVRLAYATIGDGPPLVKAANWLSHLEYDWQSPIWRHWLTGMARHHTLIRYDERGCGLSDWDVSDMSFEAWVRDLETVVDAAGVQRFPLIGISQGGPIAIEYAVRHPERVSHLVLYGTYARGKLKRDPTPQQIEEVETLLKLIRLGWGRENPAFRQVFASLFIPDATLEQHRWFNELQRASASPENAVRIVAGFNHIDVRPQAAQLHVPTLVLHTRNDQRVPFEEGRLLASLIPGARFVALEGSNHILLEHDPAWEQFQIEVDQFLAADAHPDRPSPPIELIDRSGPRHTPPAPAKGFIGREKELADLHRLIVNDPACRLLTLIGPGGIGKTRLALEVAQRSLNDFRDGVCFAPMASVTEAAIVPAALAEALNFSLAGTAAPQTQLLNYLRDKHLLLIFDNFEHVTAAADRLAEILAAAPHVKVLVTSRERLNLQDEWVYILGGMAFPPADEQLAAEIPPENYSAVSLFIQRARQAVVRFAPDADDLRAIVHICQLVEGSPLAIELAAAWINVLDCAAIAAEIQRDLEVLTARRLDAAAHHRSIQTVFNHTWLRLSADEQHVFKQLSVFRGGFQRAAAAQVAAASLDNLSALVDKSLLRRDPAGRYHVHELLRQYAAAKLAASPEDEHHTFDRHGRYYADFLADRFDDILNGRQLPMTQLTELEIANLRAAWQWAVTRRRADFMLHAVPVIWSFSEFRCRYLEGVNLLSQALDVLPADAAAEPIRRGRAHTLVSLAWLLIRLGRLDEAENLSQEAMTIYEQLGASPVLGVATDPRVALGVLASIRGDYAAMSRLGEQAVQISEAHDHRWNRPYAYYLLTRAALAQGDYEQAQINAQRAGRAAQQSNDRWFLAYCLNELGNVALARDEFDTARDHFQASFVIRQEFDDREGMAIALNRLATVKLRQGDAAEAGQLYNRSLELYRELDDKGGLTSTLNGLGFVAMTHGDQTGACDYFRRALELAHELRFVPLMLWIVLGVGELLLRTQRPERGVELLSLVIHHPAGEREAGLRARQCLDRFRDALPPLRYAASYQRGQTSDLDAVSTQLLTDLLAWQSL